MKKRKLILTFTFAVAVALELLPFGVMCNFSDGEQTVLRRFSYFSMVPYAYGCMLPLVAAILSVAALVLSVVYLTPKIAGRRAVAVPWIIVAVAAVASVASMLHILLRWEWRTLPGALIAAVLVAGTALAVFAARKETDGKPGGLAR